MPTYFCFAKSSLKRKHRSNHQHILNVDVSRTRGKSQRQLGGICMYFSKKKKSPSGIYLDKKEKKSYYAQKKKLQ